MSELKPCPFCGSPAEWANWGGHKYLRCDNTDCFMEVRVWAEVGVERQPEIWNNRPIEDALQSRVGRLEAVLKRLELESRVRDDISDRLYCTRCYLHDGKHAKECPFDVLDEEGGDAS